MQLKNDAKYDMVVPSSMGVRITPINSQPIHCSDTFFMQATSAETNVASISSYLGKRVKVLTKFVKDSPISAFIKTNLLSRRIEFEGIDVEQGGPWGFRHQFNIADTGFGQRGPRVHNDRAGEVGRTLQPGDFDLERIFKSEGVRILHLSGLIASLSSQTGEFCSQLVKIAKKHGSIVSFDINYRASFWKGREKELKPIFKEIATQADVLFGSTEDFIRCFGYDMKHNESNDFDTRIEDYKNSILTIKNDFPDTRIFSTSLRESLSANKHMWGAILYSDENWHIIHPQAIDVLDRIGGGDAYVGGILYGLLQNWNIEKCLQFGWACGVMAVTQITDYAQPFNEDQIWDIWYKDARIKR